MDPVEFFDHGLPSCSKARLATNHSAKAASAISVPVADFRRPHWHANGSWCRATETAIKRRVDAAILAGSQGLVIVMETEQELEERGEIARAVRSDTPAAMCAARALGP
ncbi:MAG: hypothetical protein ACE5NA_09220 [Nitrospiraceae bacterium]